MKRLLMVIFVPFFLFACSSADDDLSGDVRAEEEESKDFSSSQIQDIRVKTTNGSIMSSAWDDNSIHVLLKR